MLEIRSNGTLSATGKTLTGYAAVFNSEAVLGDFSEVIRQGAFAKSLATGSNIRALYQHQGDALLGTTRGGTLQLREDAKGLAFELALPDTSHGKDLAILVGRGDSGAQRGGQQRQHAAPHAFIGREAGQEQKLGEWDMGESGHHQVGARSAKERQPRQRGTDRAL